MDTDTSLLLATAFGGFLGATLKALISTDQVLLARKTIVDLIVGTLTGMLYPATWYPEMAYSTMRKGAWVALVSYATSDFAQNMITRIRENKVPTLTKP